MPHGEKLPPAQVAYNAVLLLVRCTVLLGVGVAVIMLLLRLTGALGLP